MNGMLYWKVQRLVRTTKYRSVHVSEELIRASVHGHVFGILHICHDVRVLGSTVQLFGGCG